MASAIVISQAAMPTPTMTRWRPGWKPKASRNLSEKGGLKGVSAPRLYFLAGLGHIGGRDRPEMGRARGFAPRTPCFSDSFLDRLPPLGRPFERAGDNMCARRQQAQRSYQPNRAGPGLG